MDHHLSPFECHMIKWLAHVKILNIVKWQISIFLQKDLTNIQYDEKILEITEEACWQM